MLTIHHLHTSQSERIVWLCEELALPYELKCYARDEKTRLATPEYKALHPLGTAPVITDGPIVLAESVAVMEYIMTRYGSGTLVPGPSAANFPDYLFWYHFANGTLQPLLGRSMVLNRASLPDDHPMQRFVTSRREAALQMLEKRLGETAFLAGEALSAADIMTVFSLTTMRLFFPFDLAPYSNIRRYLQRIGERQAYRQAMAKGDPTLTPMLD